MFLQTQNGKSLINADFVSQIYLEDAAGGEVKLMAVTDNEIPLGTYKNAEHAEMAMKFIGIALVDPDSQAKITVVPTREDMDFKDSLFPDGLCPAGMKKLLERVMTSRGGGYPKCPKMMSLTSLLY